MKLISVNLGEQRPIQNGKASGKSGIFKLPVKGPVQITRTGLPGDAICDTKNHGGPDQAVYVYGEPDYTWWSGALSRELLPGTFGENLTVRSLESAQLRVGDVLWIGTAALQVTAPRIPCKTLAARMEDPEFIKRFREAERPGAYCRVLQEGLVQAGDPVSLERFGGKTVTLLEMLRDFYAPDLTEASLRRYLAAPLALRARRDKEAQLQRLRSA